MLSSNQKQALKKIAHKLHQAGTDWLLMGTASQYLQGIEVTPHDIDIIVRLEDLEILRDLFKAYDPSPIEKIRPNHYKFNFVINAVNIEIIGEKEAKKYFENKEEYLTRKDLGNVPIPCRKLEKEIELYEKLGREKKVKKIKKFLK